MLDKPSSSISIGVEIQSSGLKFAALRKAEKTPLISSDVKQLYKETEDPLFVTPLFTSNVLLRTLDVKLKKISDIEETLSFLAEPLLPYPIEDAILQKIILEKKKDGTSLCFIAVQKEFLAKHLSFFEGVNPEVVTAIPAALAAFSNNFLTHKSPLLIIHLSHQETTSVAIENNFPVSAQTSLSLLNDQRDQPLMDLKRVVYSISKSIPFAKILLTGEGVSDKDLVETLKQNFSTKIETHPHSVDAVSIGSALTTEDSQSSLFINFRKKEFSYPKPFKRFIKPALLYLSLSITLAFSFFLYSKAKISSEEDLVRENYISLLADRGKTYHSFESEFTFDEEANLNPSALSLSDIEDRLDALEAKHKLAPSLFPLQPTTPFVSDLIAWLSTHEVITKTEGFLLESLNYTMVKRPDQTKRNEKYQVKVELEFSCQTPMQAREFHDALLAPNDFVDLKNEVKWSSNRGRFRAVFFLKDHTKYKGKKLGYA